MLRVIPVEVNLEKETASISNEEGALAPKYDDFNDPQAKDFHEVDVLSQLKANIEHLEGLHFRLNYLMSEIRTVIKK